MLFIMQLSKLFNKYYYHQTELATTSPMVHGALRRVDQWQQQLTETLESRAPPSDYIPGCFPEQLPTGPPINKYRYVNLEIKLETSKHRRHYSSLCQFQLTY